jgi:hypothetical protein
MQAIHGQNEQTGENAVVKLIADKMLNYATGLELSTTDTVRNQRAYGMLNRQPELDVNTAQAAAYMNNHEKTDKDTKVKKTTAGFAGSDFAPNIKDLDSDSHARLKRKCFKCFLLKYVWIC